MNVACLIWEGAAEKGYEKFVVNVLVEKWLYDPSPTINAYEAKCSKQFNRKLVLSYQFSRRTWGYANMSCYYAIEIAVSDSINRSQIRYAMCQL
jgi:hypothetical protein